MLELAHQAGVPCPRVVTDLTKLSIDYGGEVFHRLVMQQLRNDPVDRCDLESYAMSLGQAVQRLHQQAGVLHCDIKPSNVLWNASTKTAALVDFGHAQRESGASAYLGAQRYTSPEVAQGRCPHGRRSDAYSVGRTILDVCSLAAEVGTAPPLAGEDRVRRVASELAREHPENRIALVVALQQFGLSRDGSTTIPPSQPVASVSPDSATRRGADAVART
jgi:serine/threonine protein kinase